MTDTTPAPRPHRQRVLKGATIIAGSKSSEIACAIRNQHEGGAELRVAVDAPVPETFQLYVPVDGIAYQCVVKWRRNDRLGVAFTGTGAKPRHHY